MTKNTAATLVVRKPMRTENALMLGLFGLTLVAGFASSKSLHIAAGLALTGAVGWHVYKRRTALEDKIPNAGQGLWPCPVSLPVVTVALGRTCCLAAAGRPRAAAVARLAFELLAEIANKKDQSQKDDDADYDVL